MRDRRGHGLVGLVQAQRVDVDRDARVIGPLGRLLDVLEHVFQRRLVGEGHRDRLIELLEDLLGLGVAVEDVDGLAVLGDPPLGEDPPALGVGILDDLVVGEGDRGPVDVLASSACSGTP